MKQSEKQTSSTRSQNNVLSPSQKPGRPCKIKFTRAERMKTELHSIMKTGIYLHKRGQLLWTSPLNRRRRPIKEVAWTHTVRACSTILIFSILLWHPELPEEELHPHYQEGIAPKKWQMEMGVRPCQTFWGQELHSALHELSPTQPTQENHSAYAPDNWKLARTVLEGWITQRETPAGNMRK